MAAILLLLFLQTTQRIIEDHKPLVEDLVSTGHELMDVCTEEDAAAVREDVEAVSQGYEQAKTGVRERLNSLDDAFRSTTADVSRRRVIMNLWVFARE